MKISIKGHPNKRNITGFNEGMFRARQNLILKEVSRILTERGISHRIDHTEKRLYKPKYNSNDPSSTAVLDGFDYLVLNEELSWSESGTFKTYFYVKCATGCRVTYNVRASLVGCFGKKFIVENYRDWASNMWTLSYSQPNEVVYGDKEQIYVDAVEDKNNEIDVESVVNAILAKRAEIAPMIMEQRQQNSKDNFLLAVFSAIVQNTIDDDELAGFDKNKINKTSSEQQRVWFIPGSDASKDSVKIIARVHSYNTISFSCENFIDYFNKSEISLKYSSEDIDQAQDEIPEILRNSLKGYALLNRIVNKK